MNQLRNRLVRILSRVLPCFEAGRAVARVAAWMTGLCVLLALASSDVFAQRQMEALGRGMIAVRSTSTQAYVGWRLLGDDPDGIAFNLYRSANGAAAVKLNSSPLTATTDFTDTTATFTVSNAYYVRPVVGGVEQAAGATFTLPANTAVGQYLTIPLQIPPAGTNASGSYTYTANDCSVGDLDGDGEYEIIVKWDPTNSKDNSQSGYTGDTYLDAYKLDGTRLWRIDFGVNIRSGAHYMDFMVYDFDGDGRAEIMCRTAPGTLDATGTYVGGAAKWQGAARPAFNDTDDYRNTAGYILYGPEFLSVFDGLTGGELATVRFFPQRDPDNLIDNPTSARLTTLWGDGYGNRFDRFLAAVAYVDGQRPTGIFARGYYTRTFLTAWDWRGGQLTQRWAFDSGIGPAANRAYAGQGAHSISVGDLDGDGKDEIAYGACAIDDNGTGLWSTGLGHGDATHLSEMDPDNPGLKFFMPHESPSSYGIYGTSLTEQRDGTPLWGAPGGGDVGRGVAFDIDPRYPGYEAWATNSSVVYTVKGVPITTSSRPAVNFGVWWDADPLRELLDGTTISKWVPASANTTTLLSMSGTSSNNGTKATPNLSGDILGDWREEVVLRTSDNTALRIYTTTIPATNRLYTLMHDPQYREAIAWQNTGYNQPPHPGFFLGQDMSAPPRAPIWHGNLVWKGSAGTNLWDADVSARWLRAGVASTFTGTDSVLLDYTGDTSSALTLTGTLTPGEVVVHNAKGKDYTFAGTGTLSGPMTLTKAGLGALTLSSAHAYTGQTHVEQGDFIVNAALSASPVVLEGLGRVAGTGTLGNGLTVVARGRVAPGTVGTAGTLSVGNQLSLTNAVLEFDLGATPAATSDRLSVTGNLVLSGTTRIELKLSGGALASGSYPLITYTGALTGTVANLSLTGLAGSPGTLSFSGGALVLTVASTRAPDALVWRGSGSAWDVATSQNWLLGGTPATFVTGDAVRFDATGAASATVSLATEVFPASVTFDATTAYTVSGAGVIGGAGGLTKTNTGTLTVQTANTYTGPTVLNGGVLAIPSVSAAGVASPLGAATSSAANLVFNGGTLRYTGALNFSTNRGVTLSAGGGTYEISTSSASLVWAGGLTGAGTLTKTGAGTLNLAGVNTYTGGTLIKAGTLLLGSFDANEDGLGTGLVTLDGGTLSMTDLQSNNSCTWNLSVPASTTGRLNADGRCTLNGALTGAGIFTFYTPFSRTALSGNWSAFTGQINVITDSDGGEFRINNSYGYANASVDLANLVNAYSLTGSTSIGAVSGSTGAVMSSTAWTIGAKNTDSTYAGVITGNSLTKVGTGALTLASSATTSLATTTTSGNTTVTLASTTGLIPQMPVTGTGIPAGTRIATVVGSTSLTLTKAATATGSPTLVYTSINSYTGATTVSAGALVVDGVIGSSAVTVNAGAALGGAGVFAAPVTFQSGSKLRTTGAASGPVFAGILTFNGPVTILPSGTLGAATYQLFTYTGTLVGTPSFVWSDPAFTATFNTATPGVVSMTLVATGTRAPADLVWSGAASALWDTSAINWKFATGGAATTFLAQDRVRFDDTRAGNPTVSVAGPLNPATVTVDATTAYTFASTANGLSGSTSLVKTGSGTLSLTGSNTLTGGVTLQAGTLALADETANLSGLGTGPIILEGGTLQQLDGSGSYSTATYDLRVPAGASPTLRVDSRMELFGPLTGSGTLNLYVPWVRFKVSGDWSAFTGSINVTSDADGGLFRLSSTSALPLARVDLGAKVTLLAFLSQTQTLAVGALSGASDATLSGIGNDNNTPASAYIATWQIGGLGTDATFSGAITNGTSPSRTAINKVGAGTWTVGGACTYTGPTVVTAGTLRFGGTLTNTSTVEVLSGATLNLTGTLTVASVTIRAGGLLTGGGIINGAVINEGVFFADGPGVAWTINGTVANTGTIRLTRGATLAASGAFTNNGTLDLITAGSAAPAGITGSGIVLTAGSVATPGIAPTVGGDIEVTLTTHAGHLYQLQRCTDLVVGDWQNLGAPQSGTGGPVIFTDTPAPTDTRLFYRVIVSP
jgi:fibronectin-binding autotransporter adhesin